MPARLILLLAALAAPTASRAASDSLMIAAPHAPEPRSARPVAPAAPAPSSSIRPDPKGPDDSALRYYAGHGEVARAEEEKRRLERLYPGWSPPKDLYSAGGADVEDESALWSLFAADRLADLRKAIVDRERSEPGWRPSEDLRKKLRAKEMRERVMSLWKAGRWSELVALVRSPEYDPSLVDVDAMWSVAEGFARTKQTAAALRIYQSILKTDANAHERLATYQKAMATLPMGSVEILLAGARTLADGQPEYEPILIDVIRARMSAFLAGVRGDPVPEDQIAKFESYAREAAQPDQAALVAWYRYKLGDPRAALDWFKLAISRGGDAMVAHGLANCLVALGYRREAEDVAYAWRELVNNEILFIDQVGARLTDPAPKPISPARLAKYALLTERSQSGEGAQALGWYAYDTCQFDIALTWFRRAAAWKPSEATIRGYALSLRRLGERTAFYDLVNRYDGLFAGVEDLIFPDGLRHPPTLCERRRKTPEGAQKIGRLLVPAPAGAAMERHSTAPDQLASEKPPPARPMRMPKIDRREFPVSTDPSNPLARFGSQDERGTGLVFLPEPSKGPWPTVARRVPGVGPMPYERYGYSLLPAWNGAAEATWPPYSLQSPSKGTQAWFDLRQNAARGSEAQDRSPAPIDSPTGKSDAALAPPALSASGRTPAPSNPPGPSPSRRAAAPAPQLPILAREEAPSSISFRRMSNASDLRRNPANPPPIPAIRFEGENR